jgi:hypothetical protein
MSAMLGGHEAVRIMVQEIGDVIGNRRLQAFERAVRAELYKRHPLGGSAQDWISAIAHVIVDNDDTKADEGFKRGIRRIRAEAARR